MNIDEHLMKLAEELLRVRNDLRQIERMSHLHQAWIQALETFVVDHSGPNAALELRRLKQTTYDKHLLKIESAAPAFASDLDMRDYMSPEDQAEWRAVD